MFSAAPLRPFKRWRQLCLILAIGFGLISTGLVPSLQAAPLKFDMQTLDDFLSLGANTVRELEAAIPMVSSELQAILATIKSELDSTLKNLSLTYQDNLNVTLNSLDGVMRKRLTDLQRLMDQVHQAIQSDISLISTELQATITTACEELKASLTTVIIVGGETTAYVLDKTADNAIVILALVLLGAGLLILIWLLFSRRLPQGFAGLLTFLFIAAFLVLFGTLAFVPTVRAYAMSYAGIGLQQRLAKVDSEPRISRIVPPKITLGRTTEIKVWGSQLCPPGKNVTVKIGNHDVPVRAHDSQQIVLSTNNLNAPDGSHDLTVLYDGQTGPRGVVEVVRPTPTPTPPDLSIVSMTADPQSVIENHTVTLNVSVRNLGGAANPTLLQVMPYPTARSLEVNIPGLAPGEQLHFAFTTVYPRAGTYDAVATVDPDNQVPESREDNNHFSVSVAVQRPEPQHRTINVTVQAYGHNCMIGPCGSESIRYTYNAPAGWRIDQSQGDNGHPGMSLIKDNCNNQARETLRAYNYGATSDYQVTVTGEIRGAGGYGPGAIFNREYRIYLIEILP